MHDLQLKPGHRVANYVLLEQLGAGAFGVVWKARHHERPDQIVALKLSTDPSYDRQLRREARLPKFDHPNIVGVLDSDTWADPPYLAMEYIPGPSLRQVIDESPGGLSESFVRRIVTDVLRGLSCAHAKGVIHRDLKPENVLLVSPGGPAKVADFGLRELTGFDSVASLQHSLSIDRDEKHQLVGSLAYMSPEQREGRPVDARADIYALSVIIFEMLTGHRPTGLELPSSRRKGLSSWWDRFYQKAAAPLDRRPASAAIWLKALRQGQPPTEAAPTPASAVPAVRAEVDETVREWRREIRFHPNDAASYYYLAKALYKNGDLDEAIKVYRQAQKLDPSFESLDLLRDEGDTCELYYRAIELYPDEWRLRSELGRLLCDDGEAQEVIEQCRRAIQLHPSDAESHYHLAIGLYRQGDLDQAIQVYHRARKLDPSVGGLRGFATDGPSEEVYRRALEFYPDEPWPRMELFSHLALSGKQDDATEQLHWAMQLGANDAEIQRDFGELSEDGGELEEAGKEFRRAIHLDPNNATYHQCLARVLTKQDDLNGAVRELRRALQLAPGDVDVHEELCKALHKQGYLDEAIRVYRRAMDRTSDLGGTLLEEWDLDLETGEPVDGYDDACEILYRRAIELYPDEAWPRMEFASHLPLSGQQEQAIEQYRRAIELCPNEASFHDEFATHLRLSGEHEQAIEQYRRAIQLGSNDPSTHYFLAATLCQCGRAEEALEVAHRAIGLSFDQFNVLYKQVLYQLLGELLIDTGKLHEALKILDRAVRLFPDEANVHAALARALAKNGKPSEALKECQLAIQLDKRQTDREDMEGLGLFYDGHYNIACVYALVGKSAEAITHLNQAINPDGETWDGSEELRSDVRTNSDFDKIRDDPEFRKVVEGKMGRET